MLHDPVTSTGPGSATTGGDRRLDLDANAREHWARSAILIDRVAQRCAARQDLPVAPGSSLAADDIASGPFRTSHVLRRCLVGGLGQLQAAHALLGVRPPVHPEATCALVGVALENLATAYWIFHPARRDERVERTLRWHAQDLLDLEAADPVGEHTPLVQADARLRDLDTVALRRHLAPEAVRRGCNVVTAIGYADVTLPQPSSITEAWQLGSGFVQGRPWTQATGASTPPAHAVYVAALQLLEALLGLYEQRARMSLI